jgi:hypothetical protein
MFAFVSPDHASLAPNCQGPVPYPRLRPQVFYRGFVLGTFFAVGCDTVVVALPLAVFFVRLRVRFDFDFAVFVFVVFEAPAFGDVEEFVACCVARVECLTR